MYKAKFDPSEKRKVWHLFITSTLVSHRGPIFWIVEIPFEQPCTAEEAICGVDDVLTERGQIFVTRLHTSSPAGDDGARYVTGREPGLIGQNGVFTVVACQNDLIDKTRK